MVGYKSTIAVTLVGLLALPGAPHAAAESDCGDDHEKTTFSWDDTDYDACTDWEYCPDLDGDVGCPSLSICLPEEAWQASELDLKANGEYRDEMECRSPALVLEGVINTIMSADVPKCDTRFGTGWYPVDDAKGNGDTTIALWHDYFGGFAMTWSASQAQSQSQSDRFGLAAHVRSQAGEGGAFNEMQQTNPCYLVGTFSDTTIKWAWLGVVWSNYMEVTNGCDTSEWAEISHTTTAETKAKFDLFDFSGGEVSYSISHSDTETQGSSVTCGEHTTSISDFGLTGQGGEGGWQSVPNCQDSARAIGFGDEDGGEASPYYFLVTYQDPECPAAGDVELWYDEDANRKWNPKYDRKEYDSGDEVIIL